MIFLAIFLLLFVSIVIKYLNDRRQTEEIAKHFPSPPRVPYLGYTRFTENLRHDPYEIFHTMMTFPRKYGQNVVVRGIFNYIDLVVTRPEDLEAILTGKNTKKAYPYDYIQTWLGEGLLISFGKKWFNRRKIITPTFHFKILEQFIEVFNEQDKKLVQRLDEYVDAEDCNIYEMLTAVALDNICETAMGVKVNAQDNPNSEYVQAVKEMAEIIFRRIFSLINQFRYVWHLTPSAFRARKVIKVLHNFTDKVIRERQEQLNRSACQSISPSEEDELMGKKKCSLLDMLLQATIDGEPLSHLDIREEVDTFMFEGHDTTTSGMAFTVFHLAMNPDVQQRAYEEQERIVKHEGTQCSYSTLQEMKYLEKVIKETLRLHPSVPLIGRKTLEPMQIDGVTIPTGFNLQIPIYAIHRNEKIFPDPERFDPERFSEEKERSWGPFDYIPFSASARNCIGQRFAMLEMKAVISTILRHYKIIAVEKTRKMRYRSDLVIRPIGGLYVKLEKRCNL